MKKIFGIQYTYILLILFLAYTVTNITYAYIAKHQYEEESVMLHAADSSLKRGDYEKAEHRYLTLIEKVKDQSVSHDIKAVAQRGLAALYAEQAQQLNDYDDKKEKLLKVLKLAKQYPPKYAYSSEHLHYGVRSVRLNFVYRSLADNELNNGNKKEAEMYLMDYLGLVRYGQQKLEHTYGTVLSPLHELVSYYKHNKDLDGLLMIKRQLESYRTEYPSSDFDRFEKHLDMYINEING